jgi:hypothetical protein
VAAAAPVVVLMAVVVVLDAIDGYMKSNRDKYRDTTGVRR